MCGCHLWLKAGDWIKEKNSPLAFVLLQLPFFRITSPGVKKGRSVNKTARKQVEVKNNMTFIILWSL